MGYNDAFAADFGKAGGKIGCYFPKCSYARLPEAAETRRSANRMKENIYLSCDKVECN